MVVLFAIEAKERMLAGVPANPGENLPQGSVNERASSPTEDAVPALGVNQFVANRGSLCVP